MTGKERLLGVVLDRSIPAGWIPQPAFARTLGISKSHLNDIEKGRKAVSPERAARFAQELGYSEARLVKLALQDLVDRGGLKLQVEVKAA